ncbi:MAG: flagellar biosynthetic protein FliO [Nitrosomonas sp. PRO4]|nr:flagellar biosynthetic protein FliO [Nitrosomonas sp. PRO4]
MINRQWLFLVALLLPFQALAETGRAGYVPPPSVVSTENTLQMAGGLLLVLAFIWGLTWLLKRFSLIPAAAAGTLKVVAATGVGQRERVVVVEIDNTWLVLGVAPGHVTKLHILDKPAVSSGDATQEHTSHKDFAVKLNESMKKDHV